MSSTANTNLKTIYLNGESRAVRSATLRDLLSELQIESSRVAIEQNREIVPRAAFAETAVNDGDAIEVVSFVGGG